MHVLHSIAAMRDKGMQNGQRAGDVVASPVLNGSLDSWRFLKAGFFL